MNLINAAAVVTLAQKMLSSQRRERLAVLKLNVFKNIFSEPSQGNLLTSALLILMK